MGIIVVILSLLLGACSMTPTYPTGTFVWAGCHTVTQNPSPEGSEAFFLFTPLDRGDNLYLQQVNKQGNSKVSVGEKC